MPTEKLANVKKLIEESLETTIQRVEHDGEQKQNQMSPIPNGKPLGYGQITVPLLLVINDKLDKIMKHLGI